MKLTPRAARPPSPIPLSVLLTLLWVGLIRLLFLLLASQAGSRPSSGLWTAVLFGERVLGRARLPTIIMAISLLLLLYLWLDYRSRAAGRWQGLVFLAAAALLVYLGWAVWYASWSRLAVPTAPGDMLMTAISGGWCPGAC